VQLHTIVSLSLATAVTVSAVKFGDQSARRISVAFFASWIASLLVDQYRGPHVNVAMLAIDAITLAVLVQTSLKGRRLWTVVAAAFLAIIVGSHLATLIDFRIQMNTFKFAMAMLSYGILASIAVGTWTGRSRSSAVIEVANGIQGQPRHGGVSHADADQIDRHRGEIGPVGQQREYAGAESSNDKQGRCTGQEGREG
jgi:Na+-translocating ferredoxin:NAD+ oxidoreductase RnfD subunit